jgi:hypothetical protein
MAPRTKTRAASAGFGLFFRRQYLLWWIFAVNFVLAAMATLPAAADFAGVLGHSLAGQPLVSRFDADVLIQLMTQPQIGGRGAFALFPLVFFVFMLLAEGGVLLSYRQDRRFHAAEFFAAGGRFFWRFVRLSIWLLIVLTPLLLAWGAVYRWSGRLATDSPNPLAGFRVELAGGLLLVLVFLAVRLWFDMAQVRIVAQDERSVLRALRWALRSTARHFGSLYWLFLRISVAGWIEMALLFWIWMDFVPHEHMGLSFLLAQLSLLLWLGARLWQRAGETVWYARRIDSTPLEPIAPPEPPAAPPEPMAPGTLQM